MYNSFDQKLNEVFRAIDWCRSTVFDIIETELGDQESWGYVRKQLLRAFGESHGLEARVREILAFPEIQSPNSSGKEAPNG
jgi:hypothetical protein